MMKYTTLTLGMVAMLGLAACSATSGTWTPMSDGRTAGNGDVQVTKTTSRKADRAFSHAMHK